MSDVPPPLPEPGQRLDPLQGATWVEDPQNAATPPQAPPPAPPAATPPPMASAPPVPYQDPNIAEGRFTSRKAANRVILHVDDQAYECATAAPNDPLIAAVEARESRDNVVLAKVLRTLILAVMEPADRARYEARLAGTTTEGGPIGVEEMLAHGLWLVGVYFARPTDGFAPSGAGPATPTSAPTSTAGPSPAV